MNEQNVPGWKGFHAVLQHKFDGTKLMTTIGYNHIIRGLPTDKNTIYTATKMIEGQMQTIRIEKPIITADLQLYIIAQEIRFAL